MFNIFKIVASLLFIHYSHIVNSFTFTDADVAEGATANPGDNRAARIAGRLAVLALNGTETHDSTNQLPIAVQQVKDCLGLDNSDVHSDIQSIIRAVKGLGSDADVSDTNLYTEIQNVLDGDSSILPNMLTSPTGTDTLTSAAHTLYGLLKSTDILGTGVDSLQSVIENINNFLGTTAGTSMADRIAGTFSTGLTISQMLGINDTVNIADQIGISNSISLASIIGDPSNGHNLSDSVFSRLVGISIIFPGFTGTLKSLSAIVGGKTGARKSLLTQLIGDTTSASIPLKDQIATTTDNPLAISVQGAITAVQSILGGSGTIYSNIVRINNELIGGGITTVEAIGTMPTGLTILAGIIGRPGGNNTDSLAIRLGTPDAGKTLTSIIGGSGNNLVARLGAPGTTLPSINQMIGVSSSSLAAALGNTATGNRSIAVLLGGTTTATSLYDQIVGEGGILSQIDGTITDSGNIATKLGFPTVSGGTVSTLADMIGSVINNASIASRLGDPTTFTSLVNMIGVSNPRSIAAALGNAGSDSSISTLLGGAATISLYNRIFSIFSKIDGVADDSQSIISKLTTQITSIQYNGNQLSAAIANVQGLLSNDYTSMTASRDLYRMIHDGYTNGTSGLKAKIDGTSSGAILNGLETVASVIDGTISGQLTGASNSGNLLNKLITLHNMIGTSGNNIAAKLGNPGLILSTIGKMLGANDATDLITQIGNKAATASLASIIGLPSGTTGDSLYTRLGDPSGFTGTLKSLSAIIGGTTGNTGNTLLSQLVGTSSNITTSLTSQLASAVSVQDAITSVNNALGTTVAGGVTQNRIGTMPTGFTSLAAIIGQPSLSTDSLATRLGIPTVGGTVSNLATLIGGTANTTIAGRLGDPMTGITGLAGLIRNNTAFTNANGFTVTSLNSATSINSQIAQFLALFGQTMGNGDRTFFVRQGTYNSIQEFVAALSHTT
jgi:hypothetical protein